MAWASRTVTYRRGLSEIAIPAIPGKTPATLNELGQVIIDARHRTYIIDAANLVIDGKPTLPQRGDRIVDTIHGATITFEVARPGGETEWEWVDANRRLLRLHASQITT
jgi:hypothetical protein